MTIKEETADGPRTAALSGCNENKGGEPAPAPETEQNNHQEPGRFQEPEHEGTPSFYFLQTQDPNVFWSQQTADDSNCLDFLSTQEDPEDDDEEEDENDNHDSGEDGISGPRQLALKRKAADALGANNNKIRRVVEV